MGLKGIEGSQLLTIVASAGVGWLGAVAKRVAQAQVAGGGGRQRRG